MLPLEFIARRQPALATGAQDAVGVRMTPARVVAFRKQQQFWDFFLVAEDLQWRGFGHAARVGGLPAGGHLQPQLHFRATQQRDALVLDYL